MRQLRRIRDLASGGMGSVELVVAQDGAFARAYARKRLLPKLAANGEAVALFLEEGRVAGLVRHANVVSVIDAGEDDAGPYLLMELVDGLPLAEVVRRSGVGLPVQIAVEIARQVAEGLHAAHELTTPGGGAMELVHRDLSPSNVLVGFDGIARVTDFGVARARGREFTSPGALVGKRSYMAPEQRRGIALDRRADLFSLGIVLIEMLRGEPLGRDPEECPPDPGDDRDDLPAELVALCFELTAMDQDARPATARAVASRLSQIHASLRSEEDPVDLGELMRTTFEIERKRSAEELSKVLEDDGPTRADVTLPPALHAAMKAHADDDSLPPVASMPARASEEAPARASEEASIARPERKSERSVATSTSAPVVMAPPPKPTLSPLAIAAAAAVVLLATGMGAYFAGSLGPTEVTPTVEHGEASVVETIDGEPIEDEFAPIDLDAIEFESDDGDAEITEGGEEPPSSTRRRRRRRRMRTPSESRETPEGVRTWSWE
jgi:serine/threonine-protein kinase